MRLKTTLIKNSLKLRMISNADGKFVLRVGALPRVPESFRVYEKEIADLIKILPGITEATADFTTGDITILYDETKVTPSQVAQWASVVVNVLVNNINLIQRYGESDPEYVKKQLEAILRKNVEMILGTR